MNKKYKGLSIILILLVLTFIGYNALKKDDLKEATWEKPEEILAITINGEEATSFPTTAAYEASVTCTSGTGTASWNGSKWVFNASSISKNKSRCNINFIPRTLRSYILGDNNANVGTVKTTPGASNNSTSEAVLASTQDDYGTSYYFRGTVTNNFVVYANMCWRVVRVTGDGSVRLVLYNYNGLTSDNTTPSASNPCSVTGDELAFIHDSSGTLTVRFGIYGDNAGFGLMYGNVGCSDSQYFEPSKCTRGGGTWTTSTSYANAHSNIRKSTVLQSLESWYDDVLSKQPGFSEKQLADTILCNDKSVITDSSFNPAGWTTFPSDYGVGINNNHYASVKRLVKSNTMAAGGTGPSLICPNDNLGGKLSKFTVSDTVNGNGALDKKIGLLTVDEAAFAGGIYGAYNSSYYLYQNAKEVHWLATPGIYYNPSNNHWVADNSTANGHYLYVVLNVNVHAIRPSITLDKNTASTGSGTSSDPYIVK